MPAMVTMRRNETDCCLVIRFAERSMMHRKNQTPRQTPGGWFSVADRVRRTVPESGLAAHDLRARQILHVVVIRPVARAGSAHRGGVRDFRLIGPDERARLDGDNAT